MDLETQLRIIQMLIRQYHQAEIGAWHKQLLQRKIRYLYQLYILRKRIARQEERIPMRRRFWVRSIFSVQKRLEQGFSNNLIREMNEGDHDKYFTYFRVIPAVFEQLYDRIHLLIQKEYVVREPISARMRLQITLRYLASGDSMMSLSFAFRVAHNTISKIISETCQAIYDCLKDDYFLTDPSEENWKQIIQQFSTIWNFDHCMGAVDGKQVEIRAPYNSGSAYYNYKSDFAINLMAICDTNARFLIVDVGAEGRRSDSGVLRRDNGPMAPNVFVADEGLSGFTNILTPYPRSGDLNNCKKVFNYRLSRARRIVECAFGILAARWRIFGNKIIASTKTTKKIVLAAVALHNFILSYEENQPENRRPYQTLNENDRQLAAGAFRNIAEQNGQLEANNPSIARDIFAAYFYNKGAVEWQWEKVLENNF